MKNEIKNKNFTQIYVNILKEKRTIIDMLGYRNIVERDEKIMDI